MGAVPIRLPRKAAWPQIQRDAAGGVPTHVERRCSGNSAGSPGLLRRERVAGLPELARLLR